jgi:hypothetical protein
MRLLKQIVGGLAACLFLALPVRAGEEAKTPAKSTIDLAICLDTSNSMDGLIGSVKTKLWDIVNDLARAKPTPNLRVALYSYGNNAYDPKVGWVKKDLDFTTDLDKVNEKLFGLRTFGGEEYVARVCRDAIEQLQWSKDPKALKLIFVCGNEPADQDKQVHLKDVAEKAVRKGIVINTIYCGPGDHPETKLWREFAVMSEGRYAFVDQDKGAVAVNTPHDKELAVLSSKMNKTYVFYGKEAALLSANQGAQDANALQLGVGVAAARAQSKGGTLYRFEEYDLVEKLKNDPKFDVTRIPETELSDALKKMTPEKRQAHIRKQLAEREDLQKQIRELGKKREAYVAAERKKNGSKADKVFDEAVRGALREEAKRQGIAIPK